MYDMIKANMELRLKNAYKNHSITKQRINTLYILYSMIYYVAYSKCYYWDNSFVRTQMTTFKTPL